MNITFRKQLESYSDRLLGSAASKQQRADACGVDYNYSSNIESGTKNPPVDEKDLEIARRLRLRDPESVEPLAIAIQEKIKEPETLPKDVIKFEEEHTIPIYITIKADNGEMGITEGEIEPKVSRVTLRGKLI